MAAEFIPLSRRIGTANRRLLALRPEIEAVTGSALLALPARVGALAARSADRALRGAARRLSFPCLLVDTGPLDAPRTDPGQGPTSLVLAWSGTGPAPAGPDLARAAAGLALLTDLGLLTEADEVDRSPEALARFARRYLDEPCYFDAWRRRPIAFEEAARQVAWLRDSFLGNDRRSVLVGVSRWKRRVVSSLLSGPRGRPVVAGSAAAAVALAARDGSAVAAWVTRMPPELPPLCARAAVPLRRMEDGFIRSVGLGASFRPGCSVVVDGRGMYFDPGRDSDLSHILSTAVFSPEILGRAARLRQAITTLDLSKYNVGLDPGVLALPGDRRIVLVSGQVEDDASVRAGSGAVRTNLALLEAARARNPDAFVLFKAHPDVEAGFRIGAVPPAAVARLADRVVDGLSIAALLRRVDHVETMTSLTGFEALLRGKSVALHGRPFYAGWGLTEQADGTFDRGRRLTLDELVAGTLILYPRYVDPVTLRHCTPELLVERLSAARAAAPPSRFALSAKAHFALRWRHALLGPLARHLRGARR